MTDRTLPPGTYTEVRRVWRAGDVVDLDCEMTVRLIESNPLVEETLNQVAVQRGPVVYCLETTDLPRGVHVMDVLVPESISLIARFDERLLGGGVVLDGKALVRPSTNWNGRLYREISAESTQPVNLRLIPYFAWGNRGASEMTVWMRRNE